MRACPNTRSASLRSSASSQSDNHRYAAKTKSCLGFIEGDFLGKRPSVRVVTVESSVSRSSESTSLHDREVHPLACDLMFLVGKRVSNNYLQHIITRRQICAQSNRAATNQPLHIRLAVYRHWILLPGEHRFAVAKNIYLRH